MAKRPAADSPAAEIGRRINDRRKALGLSYETLAERLQITVDGVKKLANGSSTAQFAKLAAIARALQTTPNEIVGFNYAGHDPKVLQSILEVTYEALGATEAQSSALAEIALEVLQAPPLQRARLDPETAARVQAELAVRQFLQSKPS